MAISDLFWQGAEYTIDFPEKIARALTKKRTINEVIDDAYDAVSPGFKKIGSFLNTYKYKFDQYIDTTALTVATMAAIPFGLEKLVNLLSTYPLKSSIPLTAGSLALSYQVIKKLIFGKNSFARKLWEGNKKKDKEIRAIPANWIGFWKYAKIKIWTPISKLGIKRSNIENKEEIIQQLDEESELISEQRAEQKLIRKSILQNPNFQQTVQPLRADFMSYLKTAASITTMCLMLRYAALPSVANIKNRAYDYFHPQQKIERVAKKTTIDNYLTKQKTTDDHLTKDKQAEPKQDQPAGSKLEKTLKNLEFEDLKKTIASTLEIYKIKPELFLSLISGESGFNHTTKSDKGAIGYTQLMPRTAEWLGVDPYDPRQNIEGGAKYLKFLLDKYSQDKEIALAAYNAGPTFIDKKIKELRKKGIKNPKYSNLIRCLPKETKKFVPRVLKKYKKVVSN